MAIEASQDPLHTYGVHRINPTRPGGLNPRARLPTSLGYRTDPGSSVCSAALATIPALGDLWRALHGNVLGGVL